MTIQQKPKFVVRLDTEQQRNAIHAAADARHISTNAFLLQAIDEKLGRGRAIDHVIALAQRVLPQEIASQPAVGARRVYIAGPMTGLPEFNYPAFNEAAAQLRSQGYHVENPAENPAPACGTWPAYMRIALRQMLSCDLIYLLPGWKESRGAVIEHDLAVTVGIAILGGKL